MLLSKTGLRIKQLVTQKRDKGIPYEGGEAAIDERATKRQSRTHSWISQARNSPENSMLRRSNTATSTAARTHLPLPASQTAHSSASSLCSCHCDASVTFPQHSLSQLAPHIPSPRILYLDSEASPPSSGDAMKWQKIFNPLGTSSTSSSSSFVPSAVPHAIGLDSTFDLLEALSLAPVIEDDGDKTPTQDVPQSMPGTADIGWSSNVEQLIKETDEAFKAVGFALADANVGTQEWYLNDDAGTHHALPSRAAPRRQHKAPVARAASVSKPKRKKPEEHKSRRLKPPKSPKPIPTASPRWILTDGMADIFTGKIFNRSLTDELLAPGPINRLRIDSRAASEVKKSSDSTRSGSTDEAITPIEPFHLQDLPSRIGAAGVGLVPLSPANTNPTTPPIPDRSIRRGTSNTKVLDSKDYKPLQFHNFAFPSPPSASQTPLRNFSTPYPPLLPTIAEVSPLSPIRLDCQKYPSSAVYPSSPPTQQLREQHHSTSFSSQRQKNACNHFPKTHVELQSTPYSLTSTSFRHGSIRLNNHPNTNQLRPSDIPSPVSDTCISTSGSPSSDGIKSPPTRNEKVYPPRGVGTNLDWTAFQIAISGGTGDYLMGGDQNSLQNEELESIEDISVWWDGFGYGLGGLEREDPRLKRKRKLKLREQLRGNETGVVIERSVLPLLGEEEKGVNKTVNHRPNQSSKNESKMLNLESRSQFSVPEMRREDVESVSSSLPPSPMEELRPEELSQKVAPMGFNLGHDLGDFLKWESENVGVE